MLWLETQGWEAKQQPCRGAHDRICAGSKVSISDEPAQRHCRQHQGWRGSAPVPAEQLPVQPVPWRSMLSSVTRICSPACASAMTEVRDVSSP